MVFQSEKTAVTCPKMVRCNVFLILHELSAALRIQCVCGTSMTNYGSRLHRAFCGSTPSFGLCRPAPGPWDLTNTSICAGNERSSAL